MLHGTYSEKAGGGNPFGWSKLPSHFIINVIEEENNLYVLWGLLSSSKEMTLRKGIQGDCLVAS